MKFWNSHGWGTCQKWYPKRVNDFEVTKLQELQIDSTHILKIGFYICIELLYLFGSWVRLISFFCWFIKWAHLNETAKSIAWRFRGITFRNGNIHISYLRRVIFECILLTSDVEKCREIMIMPPWTRLESRYHFCTTLDIHQILMTCDRPSRISPC